MGKNKDLDSRQKILRVAERIFAEKGFDGARVGEIAREAGVNKALIYYYFDSKEDILESLFTMLINDAKKMLEKFSLELNDATEKDFIMISEKLIDFIMGKKDILRVAMTESMKSGSKHSLIIEIGEMLMGKEIEKLRESYRIKGVEFPGNIKQVLVAEFFTGVLPVLNFVLFKDEFGSYFDMAPDELRTHFIEAFKKTHFAYHKLR